ncbi:hypothetical protein [Tolypothrix sp. VBCCA 56010]
MVVDQAAFSDINQIGRCHRNFTITSEGLTKTGPTLEPRQGSDTFLY